MRWGAVVSCHSMRHRHAQCGAMAVLGRQERLGRGDNPWRRRHHRHCLCLRVPELPVVLKGLSSRFQVCSALPLSTVSVGADWHGTHSGGQLEPQQSQILYHTPRTTLRSPTKPYTRVRFQLSQVVHTSSALPPSCSLPQQLLPSMVVGHLLMSLSGALSNLGLYSLAPDLV